MVTIIKFVPIFIFNIVSMVLTSITSDILSTRRVIFNTNQTEQLFHTYLEIYNKTYNSTGEYKKRLEVFRGNLEDINELNTGAGADVYGVTEYSDMTIEEFIDKSGISKWHIPEIDSFTLNFTCKTGIRAIPDFWDWSKLGKVTGIGNQGSCRSCWAYSATGVMEGQYAIKHNKLVSLSTQQLIDCMHRGKGCLNSMTFPHMAINAAANQGGIMPDSEYRYLGFQSACRFDKARVVARIQKAVRYFVYDEDQLKELVYTYGPVAAGFQISSGFPKYRRGIATAEKFKCVKGVLNHSVLIVGFGTANGVPYWIIKNSHGTHWGEQGYFKLKRGHNPCNIIDYIATVTLK